MPTTSSGRSRRLEKDWVVSSSLNKPLSSFMGNLNSNLDLLSASVIDTGAGICLVKEKNNLINITEIPNNNVQGVSASIADISIIGDIRIGEYLIPAAWLPELPVNRIISMGLLSKQGIIPKIDENGIFNFFDKNNNFIFSASYKNDILIETPHCKIFSSPPNVAFLAVTAEAHFMCGHQSDAVVKRGVDCGIIPRKALKRGAPFLCSACAMSRINASDKVQDGTHNPALAPGQRIHFDILDPVVHGLNPHGVGNATEFAYLLVAADEFTNWWSVTPITSRAQAPAAIFSVINKFLGSGFAVKSVRSDNAAEFRSSHFVSELNRLGVEIESSAPYDSRQRGFIENINRQVIEGLRARSVAHPQKSLSNLWPFFAGDVAFLHNRVTVAPNSSPPTSPSVAARQLSCKLGPALVTGNSVIARYPSPNGGINCPGFRAIYLGRANESGAVHYVLNETGAVETVSVVRNAHFKIAPNLIDPQISFSYPLFRLKNSNVRGNGKVRSFAGKSVKVATAKDGQPVVATDAAHHSGVHGATSPMHATSFPAEITAVPTLDKNKNSSDSDSQVASLSEHDTTPDANSADVHTDPHIDIRIGHRSSSDISKQAEEREARALRRASELPQNTSTVSTTSAHVIPVAVPGPDTTTQPSSPSPPPAPPNVADISKIACDTNIKNGNENINYVLFALLAMASSNSPQRIGKQMNYAEAVRIYGESAVVAAMRVEINSLKKFNSKMLSVVDRKDIENYKDTVRSHFIFTEKRGTLRARLVVDGNMRDLPPGASSFAPTVSSIALRGLLFKACRDKQALGVLDIKTAYVNAVLPKPIILRIPKGWPDEGEFLLCTQALYGLKESGNLWFHHLRNFLVDDLKFTNGVSDPCVFYRNVNGGRIMLAVYVDDIVIVAPSKKDLNELQEKIAKKFEISRQNDGADILGIKCLKRDDYFLLIQKTQIDEVAALFPVPILYPCKAPGGSHKDLFVPDFKAVVMRGAVKVPKMTNEAAVELMQRLVGKLSYIATHTRPDIAAAVNKFASISSQATTEHIQAIGDLIRYLVATKNRALKIRARGGDKAKVEVWSDASFASENNFKSRYSYFIYVDGVLLDWKSALLHKNCVSVHEAELSAVVEGLKSAFYVPDLIDDLNIPNEKLVNVYTDNAVTANIAECTTSYQKCTRNSAILAAYLRDCKFRGVLKTNYTPAAFSRADIGTKNLRAAANCQNADPGSHQYAVKLLDCFEDVQDDES